MSTTDLALTAHSIVANGKCILAADEAPGTMTKRFSAHGIASTPDSRRVYRELFFTTSGIAEFIGGVILQDEALTAWGGLDANLAAAQRAFYNRARCNVAAARGRYTAAMEAWPAAA